MNTQGLMRLLGSSKAIVMVVAIIGAIAATLIHGTTVTPQMALDFIKWIVVTFLGATAAEDYASKRDVPPATAPAAMMRKAAAAAAYQKSDVVRIAVINKSTRITDADAETMTKACALQLTRDAAPLWNRTAPEMTFHMDALTVHPDAYLIALMDAPDMDGVLGYHSETNGGRIVSYVFANPVLDNGGAVLADPSNPRVTSIASVLSHEALEAFVDPFVNNWADGPMRAEGCSYSFEVADPVEGDSYLVDVDGKAVAVSNFVTPHYFDNCAAGKQYDFLSKLTVPFSMSPGGYFVVRNAPGTERQVFGEKMPVWKREMKALKLGHGGLKR